MVDLNYVRLLEEAKAKAREEADLRYPPGARREREYRDLVTSILNDMTRPPFPIRKREDVPHVR
jgi:hypothetical protein